MAQIRSAELAKPIIYASNSGQSFATNANGRIVFKSFNSINDVSIVQVAANEKTTLATRYEKFLLFIFGIAILSIAAYNYFKKDDDFYA